MSRYHPYYCEENIWHLCEEAPAESLVCVITNARRSFAMWGQRSALSPGSPVFWDYHVVLFVPVGNGWEVHDLDTHLGFPVPLGRWLDGSFAHLDKVHPAYAPVFRLLPASDYRATFSSDRSHMLRPDGSWAAPPPPWPPIHDPTRPPSLERLLDVESPEPGRLLGLAALIRCEL